MPTEDITPLGKVAELNGKELLDCPEPNRESQQMSKLNQNSGLNGGLAITFSAAIWGLFWIPMRYFDDSGLSALWAIAAINFCACLIALPVAIYSGEIRRDNLRWLIILGIGMGMSNIFYFSGLILSDVVRVTLLFYLLPIWATLFSKLFFNVPIGKARSFALILAFAGIWLLLGGGSWPIPQNLGDVFGLLSGIGWAFGLTFIRGRGNLGSFATSASSTIFATIGAFLLGAVLVRIAPEIQPAFPSMKTISAMVVPLLVFSFFVLWPTLVGQLWGAQFVAATTGALFTMSEIIVATVSTTTLEGNTLSLISWIGGALIVIAIFFDLYGAKDA